MTRRTMMTVVLVDELQTKATGGGEGRRDGLVVCIPRLSLLLQCAKHRLNIPVAGGRRNVSQAC